MITKGSIRKIFKEAGAERVSNDAVNYLTEWLEANAVQITEHAVHLANMKNMKTVSETDVKASIKLQ